MKDSPTVSTAIEQAGLHPRSKHRKGYDFDALIAACPSLRQYMKLGRQGNQTIDFANPKAVKVLNQALLNLHYSVLHWTLPKGYLCPPVPSRADYLHHMADLLALSQVALSQAEKAIPQGGTVRVLDIGSGANLIYPLIGHREYGWQFIGADIDPVAIKHAQGLIQDNALENQISLRLQPNAKAIFQGVIQPQERFALTVCNPPFHASAEEASKGTARKWRAVGKPNTGAALNFGGQSNELVCEGGELAFLLRMVKESQLFKQQCLWFSTLVSKASHLPLLYQALTQAQAAEITTIPMLHGQKQSRILAWSFIAQPQHPAWWR